MDIQQNNVAVLHFNLVNQDGSTIFIRKTKLATFNLINPSEVSVPITDIGFDATLNQCWVRIPKASNAATGQYYGVLNIVDDDWGTYTTSKIKVYSVVSDADEDTKSVVFTATCLATQITNPSGGNSPYYNTTTGTWWQYSDTLKAFEDTGVGNLIKYITKNVQHLKDGTGNGSVVTCLDDEISANNIATGLCSTDFGKNNDNRGESCVALGEHNYIAEGISNATAIAGAQPTAVDVFAVGDKTAGHINVFEINKFGDIYFRPDSSQERIAILQDILDSVIKNVVYDSSKYSLTVTFYSAADNVNKTKTYDLSGLKAVLKDDAVKEISVNQSTAVMTVNTINGGSQQIQLPTTVQSDWSTTDTSADSYILNKPTALSSFANDSGYDTVTSVDSKLGNYATKTELSNHTANVSNPHGVSYTQLKGKISYVGTGATWRKIILSFTATALIYNSVRFDLTYYSNNSNSYNSRGDILLSIHFTSSTTWVSKLSVTNWYGDIPNFYLIDNGSGSFQFAISNDNLNPYAGFDIYLKHVGGDVKTYSYGDQGSTTSGSLISKSIGRACTVGALTVTKNGTSVGTFDGSANTTIALTDTTYSDVTTTTHGLMTATDKVKLNGIISNGASSIQPFDFLDSNESGTFRTQTSTNSIAVAFMTDSKVVTNKVRIFIKTTDGAKIRCAIYKQLSASESYALSLVTQTQLYTGSPAFFADIPFETITTLDSDALYFFAFECSSSDSHFLGKQINASAVSGFVLRGDAFNANSDTFKSQYPDDAVDGNVFIPYFKII